MYSKTLICVQRFCRIEIIPDYTGVGSTVPICSCVSLLGAKKPIEHLINIYSVPQIAGRL